MALNEQQIAVILQASIERASELLREEGGFLPFGGRAKPSGDIEFVQLAPESEAEPLDALVGRLAEMLSGEAERGEILGSALVANAQRADEENGEAILVLVETAGFSRSVTVPYRIEGGQIELGRMSPEAVEPKVFAGVPEPG